MYVVFSFRSLYTVIDALSLLHSLITQVFKHNQERTIQVLPAPTIYTMILSHSEFLSVILRNSPVNKRKGEIVGDLLTYLQEC